MIHNPLMINLEVLYDGVILPECDTQADALSDSLSNSPDQVMTTAENYQLNQSPAILHPPKRLAYSIFLLNNVR